MLFEDALMDDGGNRLLGSGTLLPGIQWKTPEFDDATSRSPDAHSESAMDLGLYEDHRGAENRADSHRNAFRFRVDPMLLALDSNVAH